MTSKRTTKALAITLLSLLIWGCGSVSSRPLNEAGRKEDRSAGSCHWQKRISGDPKTIWNGISGAMELTLSDKDLMVKSASKTVNVFSEITEARLEKISRESVNILTGKLRSEFTLMSVVGPLVSFENKASLSYMFGKNENPLAGPVSENVELITLNLVENVKREDFATNPSLVDLDELFSEADIYDQLIKIKEIGYGLKTATKGGEMPKSVDAVQKLLKRRGVVTILDGRYAIYPDFLKNFSFERVQGDKVIIRLVLPSTHGKDFDHYPVYMTLPIPMDMRGAFTDAEVGVNGFLSTTGRNVSSEKSSVLEYDCE